MAEMKKCELWERDDALYVKRQQEIAKLREDIAWTQKKMEGCAPESELETAREVYAAPRRVLTRLQSALAEAQKGMKEAPHGKTE
jgi:hypothetical protein